MAAFAPGREGRPNLFDASWLACAMAHLRLLLAGLFVVAALAGCASSQKPDLATVFPDQVSTTAVPEALLPFAGGATNLTVITGAQLEGRLNDAGDWVANVSTSKMAAPVSSGTMSMPEPMGGGGETTALTLNGTSAAVVEVRFKEHALLAGYTATWHFVMGGVADEPSSIPADQAFEHQLPVVGSFEVYATLSPAEGEPATAVVAEPFRGTLSATWSINGEVQPQKPSDQGAGLPVPWPTSREAMTDIYTIDLPAGATVTANTAFDGSPSPDRGTDVDIGLYTPDGEAFACSAGALDPVSPVDASQATETFAVPTDAPGVWSVQVGAMADGCPTNNGAAGSFSYANAGPVPYTLTITVS